MPYNFVADNFYKTAVLRLWAPFGGLGQRTMIILGSLKSAYSLVNFLLIELFR